LAKPLLTVPSGYEYSYNKTSIVHLKEYFAKMAIELESQEYYLREAIRFVILESSDKKLGLDVVSPKDINRYCNNVADCKLNNYVNQERNRLLNKCFDNLIGFLAKEQGEITDKIENDNWFKKLNNAIAGAFTGGASGVGAVAGGTIMIVGGTAGAVVCVPALITGAFIGVGGTVLGGVVGIPTFIGIKIVGDRKDYSYKKMLDIIYLMGKEIGKYKDQNYPQIELEDYKGCLNVEHLNLVEKIGVLIKEKQVIIKTKDTESDSKPKSFTEKEDLRSQTKTDEISKGMGE
jgi:hypothetical protein